MEATKTISLATWQPKAAPREEEPERVVEWVARRFAGQEVAMTTAFGMEGVVLLDMVARHLPSIRVIYVDTAFLFDETHALRRQLEERYPAARFEAAYPQLTPQEQAAELGPELWKRDPDLCCKMRKVEPMHRAMQGVDVWIAAIRREQSPSRRNTQLVDWDWQYQLVKVCPLVTWSRLQVYEYLVGNKLPYCELHDRGYPTFGCTHCTKPVAGAKPWEYSRNGRWAGTGKSECGLHGYGI